MSVYTTLAKVQQELKAPKNQVNNFGKYKYRSCEDILEAVKPLLAKYNAVLTLSDEVLEVAARVYIKATATFIDCETGEKITNSGYARESIDKKGMDDSQITGTSSSYARKYCLNGLFCIDDTKDADTNEYHQQTATKPINYVVKLPNNKIGLVAYGHEDKGAYPLDRLSIEQLKQCAGQERYASAKSIIEDEILKRMTEPVKF